MTREGVIVHSSGVGALQDELIVLAGHRVVSLALLFELAEVRFCELLFDRVLLEIVRENRGQHAHRLAASAGAVNIAIELLDALGALDASPQRRRPADTPAR